MAALERANSVKANRGTLKARVHGGEITVPDVVTANPPDCVNMTVRELLSAQRRWGDARTHRFLTHVGLSEWRTIGALTERERLLIEAEWHRQERAGQPHRDRVRAHRDRSSAVA
jgi:hypothetical protein